MKISMAISQLSSQNRNKDTILKIPQRYWVEQEKEDDISPEEKKEIAEGLKALKEGRIPWFKTARNAIKYLRSMRVVFTEAFLKK